ncbi:hypothetical protein R80B4_01067 [Fibrobacteres bacterium R8-0-B4]
MAENLNIATAESWCNGEGGQVRIGGNCHATNENGEAIECESYRTLSSSEIQANCSKYGRLYTWAAAKTACPNGWRLPTRDDWDRLAESVGGIRSSDYGAYHDWSVAGKKLKSTSGWDDDYHGQSGNGTNEFGFSALPGGSRYSDGVFGNVGEYGNWWTVIRPNAHAGRYLYCGMARFRVGGEASAPRDRSESRVFIVSAPRYLLYLCL